MNEIQKIITQYKRDMTFQDMADAINSTPGLTGKITRPQINNWALGIAQPKPYVLYFLANRGAGWVSHMALDLLKVIEPEML